MVNGSDFIVPSRPPGKFRFTSWKVRILRYCAQNNIDTMVEKLLFCLPFSAQGHCAYSESLQLHKHGGIRSVHRQANKALNYMTRVHRIHPSLTGKDASDILLKVNRYVKKARRTNWSYSFTWWSQLQVITLICLGVSASGITVTFRMELWEFLLANLLLLPPTLSCEMKKCKTKD